MKNLTLAVVAVAFAFSAFADEQTTDTSAQSKTKIENVKEGNKVDGNIDEEITNAKLRAESGSKSKLSASASLGYSGGTVLKPLDKDRANPTNDPVPERVNLSGSVSLRYRLSKNNSLQAGVGMSLERPLHEARRGNVSNPFVAFESAYKAGMVQNISGVTLSYTTHNDYREIGDVGTINFSQTALTDFNGSRFSGGLALEAGYTQFDKRNELVTKDQVAAINFQQDTSIALYPFAEYAINDTFQLRTVTRPWIFSHARSEETFWKFSRRPWTQSMGLGMAVSRDVYLYPNFQWDMEQWRKSDYNWFNKPVAQNTTVGLSATINMF